jgi:hypothetical protein
LLIWTRVQYVSNGSVGHGEDNTATLAAVTRRALMWERGARTNTGTVSATPLEMNAFLAENPRLRTSAEVAAKLASRSLLPASIFGLCHWLLATWTRTRRTGSSVGWRTATDSQQTTRSQPCGTGS